MDYYQKPMLNFLSSYTAADSLSVCIAGVYILENTCPLGGKKSADVIWGKKYEKGEEKKGENVKEKEGRGKMYKKKEEMGKKMRKGEAEG
jgi:hypothetical protein